MLQCLNYSFVCLAFLLTFLMPIQNFVALKHSKANQLKRKQSWDEWIQPKTHWQSMRIFSTILITFDDSIWRFVEWVQQNISQFYYIFSSWRIRVRHVPFDVQLCQMQFQSWVYSSQEVSLELRSHPDGSHGAHKDDFTESGEWDIINLPSK